MYYSVRFLAIFSKVKIDLGLNEGQSQMLGQPRYSFLLRPSILLRSLKAIKKKQIVGNTKGFFFFTFSVTLTQILPKFNLFELFFCIYHHKKYDILKTVNLRLLRNRQTNKMN